MRVFRFFLSLSLSFVLAACNSQSSEDSLYDTNPEDWVLGESANTKQNIQVPRTVWTVIKKTLQDEGVTDEILNSYSIHPTKISVELTKKDFGVLKEDKHHRFSFAEGGGEMDLFNHVDGKGAFYIRFAPSFMNDSPYHLLYLSESPGRLIGEKKWGNGCGRLFDLSENADRLLAENGMLVSTGRKQYLHLLSGVYVFFQMVEDRMLLGYVRLTDSRYPQFTCSM